MGDELPATNAHLLHYRAWRGTFRHPLAGVWPIARVSLAMLFRRRLFWWLYVAGLLIFFMFFFGTFLLDWAQTQILQTTFQIGKLQPEQVVRALRQGVSVLNGSQETYAYFFLYQGVMIMVILALAGSVLVGNDFNFGSLPFYLAKPLSRWHYLLGKGLAVGILVNLLTTLPALLLFAQHGLDDWEYVVDPNYFTRNETGHGPAGIPLLLGIVAYGLLLTVFLSLMLVATASWVRRTMPLIMVWTTIFLFFRLLSSILVDGLGYHESWRLIDLWNSLRLVGCTFLGFEHRRIVPAPQPPVWQAVVSLGALSLLCLSYLNRRTRAVEIVK
jgi:ABC-2 type transport system permease protein